MIRTLISETPQLIGKEVKLAGWVNTRRDHGKLIFIDLRDRSGIVQMVIIPDNTQAYQTAKNIRNEYVIAATGLVKKRPGSQQKENSSTGSVEIEVTRLEIISAVAKELPFDTAKANLDLNISTLLDHRHLTLRNKKVNDIFRVYAQVLKSYGEAMRENGFLEIKTPKIVSSATESGANVFKIKYFKREAFLAQSPQFYKQAGVGAFERVFEIGSVFRAEPHYTTRHVNEYISLDAEMGFIESFGDVMDMLESVVKSIISDIKENCREQLENYPGEFLIPVRFPRIKLTEALNILKNEYGKEIQGVDIDPQGERLITGWAQKNHGSDFVFLTHYPASARPFYTMPSADPQYTESFDLIYRGVELATGSQRIHDYDQLLASLKRHRLKPEDYKDYLSIFQLGMPPHGGWGMGSERLAQKILGLKSIKEAILFPRDVRRLTP